MKKITLISFTCIICLTACVSKGKFTSSQNKVKILQNDSIAAYNKLIDCKSDVLALQQEKDMVQKDLQSLSSSSQATINKSKGKFPKHYIAGETESRDGGFHDDDLVPLNING